MLKRVIGALLLVGMGAAHAFAPQTGTWVVTSELDGKPGRGIALDVQNGTLVMQVYAYQQGGQPTFYLGVGPINADGVASVPLTSYSGGRYFGSGARSGQEAGTPGTVALRFTSGTTGFATVPGESEKAISRFNFGYPFAAESLRGIWTLTSLNGTSVFTEAVVLSVRSGATANGNGIMATADDSFACEHQVRGNAAGLVICVKTDSRGQLLRSYAFTYSVNEGEGRQFSPSGGYTDQFVFVRRLTTPSGDGTGLIFKEDSPAQGMSALHQKISDLAESIRAE